MMKERMIETMVSMTETVKSKTAMLILEQDDMMGLFGSDGGTSIINMANG